MAIRVVSILMAAIISLGTAGMSLAAEIIGKVTDTRGNAVQGVKIGASKPIDKELAASVTGADGSFDIKDLKEDTYFLKLDPQATKYIGQTVMLAVPSQGMTVRWQVSTTTPAVALAEPGLTKETAFWEEDPFGMTMKQLVVTGGLSLLIIAGGVGGAAADGAFNGSNSTPARPPASVHR